MSGFDRLLCYLRAISRNNSDQGTRFEHLMKKFFLTSPLYEDVYKKKYDNMLKKEESEEK